jgi:hypothetical protein
MKNLKYVSAIIGIVFVVACAHISASAQTAEDRSKLAAINGTGSSVRWEVTAPNAGLTLTVSAPDGRVFSKTFKSGSSPNFSIADAQGERLPDGQYTYELRLTPVSSATRKDVTSNGRGKDDEPESVRAARKSAVPLQSVVESGNFSIVNGSVIVAGTSEETRPRPANKVSEQQKLPGDFSAPRLNVRLHHFSRVFMPDQVIPDDLIVQGSACIGLDCVNNENFGFDTIRLKENNTRIKFDDTSTSTGFPANDWQLTANDSASGGSSKFSIEDITGAKVPFTVTAGAATNSIFVDSTGRVGFRTSTPVLDLHVNTSNTPAMRLDQNSSGGFTAQTWDIAGNEANFFVRDVTGGSRLPFRIRPGAPTSSIDINASGNVGIGTASPATKLHSVVSSSSTATAPLDVAAIGLLVSNSDATANNVAAISLGNSAPGNQAQIGVVNLGSAVTSGGHLFFVTRAAGGSLAERMRITSAGNVGIGTNAPDMKLSVNGDADKSLGGGSWQFFSDERLKNIKGRFNSGLKAVMQLQPIRYEYKPDNALGLTSGREQVGFGAQALQRIIPEAVSKNANGYLMVNNDPILWTMLNAIKEQQKEIEQLKGQVRHLRAVRKRR